MLDFSKVIDRRNTDSWKWDVPTKSSYGDDLIQMGCADMDFKGPDEIAKALADAACSGLYGYSFMNDAFKDGIISWYRERYGCTVAKSEIVFVPRIVMAAYLFVQEFSRPEDDFIISAPYYPPLADAARDNGRNVIEAPLVEVNGRYEMDFEAMAKLLTPRTKAFVLISPHNPTGRVWTQYELDAVAAFCVKHDLLLFVDEIHSDFVSDGNKFISCASLEGPIRDKLILINAPSKTFNVMGCHCSYLIIPNIKLRKALQSIIDRAGIGQPNYFANALMKTAYQHCGYYVDAVNHVINDNDHYLREELSKIFPAARVMPRDGTFLMWVDFSKVFPSEQAMESFFTDKAGIVILPGSHFSSHFERFARINIATPRQTLEQVITRLKQALSTN